MHAKDQKIHERSYRFRNEYVASTPSWYQIGRASCRERV